MSVYRTNRTGAARKQRSDADLPRHKEPQPTITVAESMHSRRARFAVLNLRLDAASCPMCGQRTFHWKGCPRGGAS